MSNLILGAGDTGLALVKRLLEEKQQVAIIESDPDVIRGINNLFDCPVFTNSGNIIEALENADPKNFRHFIATTGIDELNLLACQLVSGMNPSILTTARVQSQAYSQLVGSEKGLLGIDYIVHSKKALSDAVISGIRYGGAGSSLYFGKSSFQLRAIRLEEGNDLIQRKVSALKNMTDQPFLIPLVVREGKALIPTGDFILHQNDIAYFLGDEKSIIPFLKSQNSKHTHETVRRIVIVGGGEIGQSIATNFYRRKGSDATDNFSAYTHNTTEIVIIEESRDVCKILADKFPKILVINTSIGNGQVLTSQVLKGYDLFIACLGNQERNILLATEAKLLGAKYTLAIASSYSYARLLPKLGLDGLLSQRESVVDAMFKIVLGGSVHRVHSLLGGEIEIFEFSVSINSKSCGKMIKELDWPRDVALIIFIQQGIKFIIPTGNYILEDNDIVGMLTITGSSLAKIRSLFEK